MNEDKFNMSMRKFLKQVGVTSQQQIEKTVREGGLSGQSNITAKVVLTVAGTDLHHVVEETIDIE